MTLLETESMAKGIRVSDEIYAEIVSESKLASRSLNGQAEHWIKIGKAIEQSGNFNYLQVKEALSANRSPDNLTAEEQEVFFDEFCESMWDEPSDDVNAFYANLSGPGMDEQGNIIQ